MRNTNKNTASASVNRLDATNNKSNPSNNEEGATVQKLVPLEHLNQRILTSQQLAEAYETEGRRISENYNRNKERFVEGKHYYCLEGEEKRAFIDHTQIAYGRNAEKLYLWTERGALFHAKSLNTDRAWEVYNVLVDTYFKAKAVPSIQPPLVIDSKFLYQMAQVLEEKERIITEMTPKAEFFDAVADSKDAMDIGIAAKILDMGFGRNTMFKMLREKGVLMQNNVPYQEFVDRGYFRVLEQKYNKPDGSCHISIKTLVYQKGLGFLRRLLAEENDSPKLGQYS